MSSGNYIVPFLIGGSTVAGIKYFGNNVNTKLAAILGAAPLGLASSFFITSMSNTRTYIRNYSIMVIVLFCSIMFYRFALYKNMTKKKGLLTALLIWLILSAILYFTPFLTKKHKKEKF